ncbi:helix-turn-helix transcriptional regulator [Anaerocolumna sp. MB42-C2]|uniref:helix-turn-helix transcriptional regulator n=1 Tax=Anaerocolumna sp. MB42-C2 TaxID=3070997 RepID=UPI0027DF8D6F|nr:AraC family transcriptional regulator [Anaerocolumna sp. MB42-C2]WMJ86557.1 AraC family transcriptional regulator [Anaerocolumna sp. MB42-C2]
MNRFNGLKRSYQKNRRYELHELSIQDEDYISLQNLVIIEKVKEYIKENYRDPQLSLTSVGEEFCITEVYLSKLFKKATGENFSKYIEGMRMKYAKELMDQNNKVADVADMAGYNSPQVFRRAWKRYYGGTPSENITCLNR